LRLQRGEGLVDVGQHGGAEGLDHGGPQCVLGRAVRGTVRKSMHTSIHTGNLPRSVDAVLNSTQGRIARAGWVTMAG
jgi:hypothetical protein